MSLALPKRKPITSSIKKADGTTASWFKHKERMNRMNMQFGRKDIKIQYLQSDSSVMRKLMDTFKSVSFNSHSWHEAVNNSITSFTVRKNGEKTILFGTSDNRHVGYLCKLNGSTTFEKLAEAVLMTKFPSDDDMQQEKFIVFIHCKHLKFTQQLDKFLDNGIFHHKMFSFVKNGNFIFEF